METIEHKMLDLFYAILRSADAEPKSFPHPSVGFSMGMYDEKPPRVIFTQFDPVFIKFTWDGLRPLTFVGFNSMSPIESLTPLSSSYPGAWKYLAVIATGATAADVIAEIELIAGVGW